MTTRQRFSGTCTAVLCGLILAALGGCRDSGLPEVFPVTGSVTFQGKPLEGATVTFFAKEGKLAAGELAFGTTDAEGRFRLRSQAGPTEALDGAIAGEHRVTISKLVPPQGMTEEVYQQKVEAEKAAGESGVYGAPREVVPPRVELLPSQYSDVQQTTLTATVKDGEANDFPFQVP
ncbi:MAG: DUF4198 domain-containing protein [Pirellulaceae bacterium]|jgi:hypothetical protein|nr:DUF4198 domain-containing protein [Pirellulaceae bacterium]